ncbi:ribonuclease III domain-containing protein [Blakeslea trispora]|nr:ribonuclease III domain-containing protein [Blakeslea trispora]
MLRHLTRTQAMSSKTLAAIKTMPRATFASIHTQQDEKLAPIVALGARLGLDLDTAVLKQALTHKSVTDTNNNATLEYVGKKVTGLFATEYLHLKYPSLHPDAFTTTLSAYLCNKSISKVASEVGLQHTIEWKAPEDNSVRLGQSTVMADCFNALVGALYQEQGQEAAKKFVHDFILSRDYDVRPSIKVKEPKRHLSALLRQLNKQPAASRLVSETGRASSAPVFVVGVFSGEEKLGEGFGSSLKMAEFRACQDALISFYGQEQKDFTLPSDADRVDKYVASPLGSTQAIV